MLDDTSAVVMTASTAVKSSPDKSSTDLFVLHEGTVVTITDRLDGWCEVVIADGKKGWVEGRKSKSSECRGFYRTLSASCRNSRA